MFTFLFSYTHISNQKKYLLRRLREVFLKEIAVESLTGTYTLDMLGWEERACWEWLTWVQRSGRLRKFIGKKKKLNLMGIKGKCYTSSLALRKKGLATNSLQGKFHLRKFLPLKELALHIRWTTLYSVLSLW